MSLHRSGEDYLEAILVLREKNGSVHSIDVAQHLGYSKPSVSRAVKILREQSYITVESDGNLCLTEKGLALAQSIYQRHTILTEFLKSLGVSDDVASNDACKIEHVISEESLEKIKNKLYGK